MRERMINCELLPVVGFTYRDDYSREVVVEAVTGLTVAIRTRDYRGRMWRGAWSMATWRRRISHLVAAGRTDV